MLPSPEQLEKRLRQLLESGLTLDQALRHAHRIDGIGLLTLCKPAETITELSAAEAKQIVVHAVNSSE